MQMGRTNKSDANAVSGRQKPNFRFKEHYAKIYVPHEMVFCFCYKAFVLLVFQSICL